MAICEETPASKFGKELTKFAVGSGIAAAYVGWALSKDSGKADWEAQSAGIAYGFILGVIPLALGYGMSQYGKICK